MTSVNPSFVATTTETDFKSFSAAVLKPLLQFITTECLAALPTSSLDIADFVIQLLSANKEYVNQMCRSGKPLGLFIEKPSHLSAPSASLVDCRAAVSNASKRRDVAFLRRVFDKYSNNADSRGGLSGENLVQALTEADSPNIPTSDTDVDYIVRLFDANGSGVLNFSEFQQVVNQPDELYLWLSEKQLPLASDALRALVGRGSDQLKKLSQLSPAAIDDAASATCSVIPGMLKELHRELQAAFAIQSQIEADALAHPSKFNEVHRMACGDISDFHNGLTERIGMPHLNFKNAMRQEHCERTGCDVVFTTGNYQITTTPKLEWQYIVEQVSCPDMGHQRRIISIHELLQRDLCKKANLCEEEVIAIVLYTGPMFQVYNTILRQHPKDKFMLFEEGNNLFSTTIFVLVSAVQKLSRSTRIAPGTQLYRGLGGRVDLPDIFFQIDDKGCSGFAEWGFLSTTSDRDVALGYSGVKERRPKAMVMVIETSSIDRGADISEFSQYPCEKEFLYLPCSYVQREQRGAGRVAVLDGGIVTFVPVKVNINLKTETVEELKEKKRRLHLVSARSMVEEVRYELTEWSKSAETKARGQKDVWCNDSDIGYLVSQIVWQCESVVQRHEAAGLEDYVDDGTFRALVGEMLDTKAWAMEKKELWMQDLSQNAQLILGKSLRDCHRLWQSFLRQSLVSSKLASAGLELLKSRGLVKRGVQGEVNADEEDVLMQAGGDGWTALDIHAAAAAGADVTASDDSSSCCVWNAARYGHKESIAALLEVKGDVNKCNYAGESPLFAAAENGHADCVSLLLSAGAHLNLCAADLGEFSGWSPLHIAAFHGRADCLKLLLDANGDVNKCTENGLSLIYAASIKGHVGCLSLLLEGGGDVNKCVSNSGLSPIYPAAKNGHADYLKILLAARADPSSTADGASALHIAREKNHTECVRLLEAALAGQV
jgi:hypothetical protein